MKKHEASATWLSPQEEPTQPPSPRRKNDVVLITPERAAEMQRLAQEAYGLQPPVPTPKRKERGEDKMQREIEESIGLATRELDIEIDALNKRIAMLRPGRAHTIIFEPGLKPRSDQRLPQPGTPEQIEALENDLSSLMRQKVDLRQGLEAIQSGQPLTQEFIQAMEASAAATYDDSLKKNIKALLTLIRHGAFKGAT